MNEKIVLFPILIRASTAIAAFFVAKSEFVFISFISVEKRSNVDKRTIISEQLVEQYGKDFAY